MSEELISSVIAARHAAEKLHANADGSPRTEAQHAAILLAQVEAILAARSLPPAPPPEPVVQAKEPEVAPTPAIEPAPEPESPPEPAAEPVEEAKT